MSDTDQATPTQVILRRITKLLKLADESRNSSEAEAAAAAAKVQEYLHEYGLSMAEVEAAGGKADDGGREKRLVRRSSMYAWQRLLMQTLAETSFCLHLVVKERDEQTGRLANCHRLIGRRVNVDAALMTYDYLLGAMKRLIADTGYKLGTHSESDYHSWLEGCSQRLRERLVERQQEAVKEGERRKRATQGNGSHRELVLSDAYGSEKDLNNDELNGFAPGTTANRRRETQERQSRIDAEYEKLTQAGVEQIEAWYRANGYGDESIAMSARYHDQQKSDSKRQRRSSGRGYRGSGWTRRDQREYEKRNSAAYLQGSEAGGDIGLDPQAAHQDRRKLS